METLPQLPARHDQILIVEDSATQAERLKFILENNHYHLTTARNGKEALACIAAQAPSLIISDIVMPEMDGYELCRHLKTDDRWRGIPIILLTSLNDPVDVVKGLECGADNFVFKPYDERYLVSRIGYILANRHLREIETTRMGVEVFFAGRKFFITSDRLQILNLLLSTYETAVERNRELANARDDLRHLNETLEAKVQERTAALQAEIQERKQAEEHVREQAELLNKAGDAIVAMDLSHRITYWNTSAERLYGWAAAEAVGRQIEELALSDVTTRFQAAEAEVLAKGEWRGEFSVTTKTGEAKFISSTWSLVRGADERPKLMLMIDTDITEQKKLEADLLRSQRMESIGLLAGGVAHDLNNALAPILMATELLRASTSDPEQQHLLDMIRGSAKRGADMVKQVLAFAKGAEGKRGQVQVRHLIREIEELCRQTFPKNIELRSEFTAEIWPVIADPTQLHQVLLNLTVNARDAMPKGGSITLTATNVTVDDSYARMSSPGAKPGSYVVIGVSDTGTGMSPEICERIFDPFFTTKGPEKGTGLGLATVQNILKNHGGFVTVKSTQGVGTEFRIHLPAEMSAVGAVEPAERPAPPMGNGELVLVADDEAAIRNIAAQTLQTYGYTVLTAVNGAEAVALCAQHRDKLRVLIADLGMPVMDGLAAIHAVRSIAPHVMTIATSGLDAVSQEVKGTAVGVGAHTNLNKPYSADQLLHAVHDVLASAH
ncbi:MAG: response regulator [Opitutus sp.]|nr:response regulator [Opitutus sp.]